MAFEGADVDGLDQVAQECTQAAQVCDEVRMVCEAIVAAASFFGPFGAAFIAYLKGVVIPWLQRISQALQLFAKVLSAHSAAQRDASSAATSLPSYTSATGLPATSTLNYPVLTAAGGSEGTPGAAGELGGSEPKPIAPGTYEFTRNFGAIMNKDALEEFSGKFTGSEPSRLHPTLTLGQVNGDASVFSASGDHYSVKVLDVNGSAAAFAGYDPKDGYQLGAGGQVAANLVDVKFSGQVPLGAGSDLGLSNQTTVGANASVQAVAAFNPSTGMASASASAQAFIGVQNTTSVDVVTPYFTDRTELTGQAGAGAAAIGQVEVGGGHLVIHGAAGVAVGLGGKISNSLDVNYGAIATDVGHGVDYIETTASDYAGALLGVPTATGSK